jgi:hypothetical protein
MDNFSELKELWQQTGSKHPIDIAETIAFVKGYHKKQVMKTGGAFIIMTVTFGVILYVAISYQSQLIITKIGFGCILLAIVGFMLLMTNMVSGFFKKENTTNDNKAYLIQMKEFQRKQSFIHTTGISIYFILLSAGLALSMYEITRRNVTFAIGAYLVTGAWIALNWFYFRPITIRKQKKKIDEVIERLERIEQQLS